MLWLRIIVIGSLALLSLDATAEEKEKCGPYDGVDLTNDPVLLEEILSAHKEWSVDSEWREDDPRRANLCRANLVSANLSKAQLFGANLTEAYLSKALLLGANLSKTNLTEAVLWDANLSGAVLINANLSEANLTDAVLWDADLEGANLSEAGLWRANLSKTNLEGANLTEANLEGANLTEAYLEGANLSEANLSKADLSKAKLIQTDLTNARVTAAGFSGVQYEPSSAPSKGYLSGIQGLRDVWFEKGNQGGLVLLRAALKEAGLRELEREATYAIERGKTSYASGLERWLRLILFEWTSGYGLNYGRPLLILLSLLFPFAAVYCLPLAGGGTSRIYRVWSNERIEDDKPEGNPVRSTKPLVFDPFKDDLRVVGFALYFSVLSAVHIGWRDLNIGSWIARVQPHEYTLRAKGWVRTVSGIQSLISIYLLALWVLIYFGRPFG